MSEDLKKVEKVFEEVSKVVVGQRELVESLVMGFLTGGHILLEGVPGLAKTLSVSTLSETLSLKFQRIQFTPDLLPTDLIGTMIFNPKSGEFSPKKGPIFTQILLADEINRAPAKVQSALLESMAERQVTIGEKTYKLDNPFLVLATQNPIEQEGTYNLPEAQMDRFMFKVIVGYPLEDEEAQILERMSKGNPEKVTPIFHQEDILRVQKEVENIHIEPRIKNYIVSLVMATRNPERYGLREIQSLLRMGVSPRATIYLAKASRARAFLKGRDYVTSDDVKTMIFPVFRHRVILTYEAEAEEVVSDKIIQKILHSVEVP